MPRYQGWATWRVEDAEKQEMPREVGGQPGTTARASVEAERSGTAQNASADENEPVFDRDEPARNLSTKRQT